MTNNLVDAARLAAQEDTCRNPGLIHRLADTIESLTSPDNGDMGNSRRERHLNDDRTRLTIVCTPGVTPDQLAELLIRAWHEGLVQAWLIDPPTKRQNTSV